MFSNTAEALAGVDAWPGAEYSYRFGGTGSQPELTVTVSSRPDWAVPGQDEPPHSAGPSEQAERYQKIGAALDTAGVTVSVLSTIETDLAMPVIDGTQALRRFARAAELFAGAAAAATAPELADNRGLRLADEPSVVLPGRMTLPRHARIPYSLRGGDTLAVLARRFGSTPRDLVAGNADVPDTLPAGLRVEITFEAITVATETLTGDSFGSLRARLAERHPGMSLQLVADALDRLDAALNPGPVLSCPLAVLGTGTGDRPVTAVEVQVEYGCQPVAFAAANAAMLGLLQPGVRLDLDGAVTTTAEHDTVHAVLDRLTSKGIRPTVGRLVAEHAALPLFRDGSRALLPPQPVTLTASPGRALELAALATPLVVTLRLEHSTPQSGDDRAPVERADTPVPAAADRDAFVDACLAAVPTVRLATDVDGALWTVSFDSGGIAVARVESAAGGATEAQAFALRPLYPALVDLSVAVRPVTGTGELGGPVMREYHGVDVEPWGTTFLTELESYLAEPLGSRLPDAARAQLMECARQLAHATADGLAPLLSTRPGPHADSALGNARVAMASLARTGLARAYGASVLAQYRAVVVSPYGTDGRPAARLVATVQEGSRPDPGLSSSRTELNSSDATCTFGLIADDPGVATTVTSSPRQVFDALEVDLAGEGRNTAPTLLRFVRPLTGGYGVDGLVADLPQAELPLPLREQPAAVAAQPMTTGASWAGADRPTLAEAMRWTARLSYQHQHAAQDVVRISIPGRTPASVATPGSSALAEALAGYLDASARLTELIGTDVQPPDGTDAATLRGNAAASLITLAAAVTAAWRVHRMNPVAAGPGPRDAVVPGAAGVQNAAGNAGFAGEYRLRAVYSASGQHVLERFVVSRTATEGDWPTIAVIFQGEQLPLTPGPVLDNSREYTATSPLITSPLAVRLGWPGLLGEPGPDTRITLTAERNVALHGARPTNPEFVLTAHPVQVAVASPSLRWEEELPLTGPDLVQALRHASEILVCGEPERRATIQVYYAEPIGELQTGLSALLVEMVLAADNAAQLAAAMRNWQRKVKPATAGAVWQLRVTVHSPQDDEPPLATFERLVYPVSTD